MKTVEAPMPDELEMAIALIEDAKAEKERFFAMKKELDNANSPGGIIFIYEKYRPKPSKERINRKLMLARQYLKEAYVKEIL